MGEDFDWALLARYLAGECGPGEARDFEEWLERRPERRREFEVLRGAWEVSSAGSHPARSRQALAVVAARAGLEIPGVSVPEVGASEDLPADVLPLPVRRPRERRSTSPAFWRVAALFFLVLAPAALWWQYGPESGEPSSQVASGPPKEYTTRRAQRATIQLADGSRVILAAESRLVIPADFGERTRTVRLEGKGYFVVRPDRDRPFRVEAEQVVTEVLGTSFLVRSAGEGSGAEVLVEEGKVAVRAPGSGLEDGVALERGEAAELDGAGRIEVRRRVDVASRLAWTEGRLVFQLTPLSAVREELQRWYDIEIELPDSALGAVGVTATFDNEPLEPVLQRLSRLLDLDYVRTGSTVRFLPEARR